MTSGRYAQDTTVPVGRTRGEIEDLLTRYGASQFGYMADVEEARIAFRIGGRAVMITLPLPSPDDRAFTQSAQGRMRAASTARTAYEQAVRSRWRALALVLKAKLEAVTVGISTIEREFLSDTVVGPGGQTLYEALRPQLESIYAGREAPALPGFERRMIEAPRP